MRSQSHLGAGAVNPLAIRARDLLRRKNGDSPISAHAKADASPWWRTLLPAGVKDGTQSFVVAPGQIVSISPEFPIDSMTRFLWTRFSVSRLEAGRYWLSMTQTLDGDDVDDDRETWDFLRDIEMRLVLDSNDGKVVHEFTSLANLMGANEFGRVRLPHLLPKQAVVTFQFRNTSNENRYVTGFVHGWRIRL